MIAIIDAKINMINTVIELVVTHSARLYVIPAFEAIFDTIISRQATVNLLLPTANGDTKSYRLARDQQIKVITDIALEVCNPTRAYASSINDNILLGEMKWTAAEFKNVTVEDLESTCQTIYDKAYAVRVAATPFGLTAGKLTALENQIPIWHTWVAAVRNRRVAIKTAKADVVKNVNENEKILKTQLDFMVQTLSATDPEMVTLWTNARQILDPQTTNTQALVTVLDSVTSEPIYQAQVQFVLGAVTYTATTDSLGEALIKPIKKPGKYNMTVSAPGYVTYFKVEVRVYLGRINRFTIELVPSV